MFRPLLALLAAAATSALALLVFVGVLNANLDADLYPSDGDTIMIPIMGAVGYTFTYLAIIAIGFGLRMLGKWPSRIGSIFLLVAVPLNGLFALAWTYENHYAIAWSQLGVCAVTCVGIIFGHKPDVSNHSPERTAGP